MSTSPPAASIAAMKASVFSLNGEARSPVLRLVGNRATQWRRSAASVGGNGPASGQRRLSRRDGAAGVVGGSMRQAYGVAGACRVAVTAPVPAGSPPPARSPASSTGIAAHVAGPRAACSAGRCRCAWRRLGRILEGLAVADLHAAVLVVLVLHARGLVRLEPVGVHDRVHADYSGLVLPSILNEAFAYHAPCRPGDRPRRRGPSAAWTARRPDQAFALAGAGVDLEGVALGRADGAGLCEVAGLHVLQVEDLGTDLGEHEGARRTLDARVVFRRRLAEAGPAAHTPCGRTRPIPPWSSAWGGASSAES